MVVDSRGLFAGLRDNIDELLGQYRALINPYKEFLKPGTWLRDKGSAWANQALERLVSSNKIREVVKRIYGAENPEQQFGEELKSVLSKAADSVTGFFDRETAGVKARLKEKVAESLPPELLTELGPRLDKVLDDGIQELRDKLRQKAVNLTRNNKDKVDGQIKEFKQLGKTITSIKDAVDSAQQRADKLFEGVREALAHIDGQLQKIHDQAARLAKEKLTISWTQTVTTSEGQSVEFDADLPVNGDLGTFDDVYDRLMRGDISEVAGLLDRDDVTVHSQALEAFAAWKKEIAYNVIFMENLISKGTILSASAKINESGEYIRVDTEGKLEKWSRDSKQQQTATFMNAMDLAAARALPAVVERQFQFRLGLKHEENKRFEEHEARNFLQEFEEIGAITSGATERAVAAMHDEQLIVPSGVSQQASIGLAMSLDEGGLSRLLKLDAPPLDVLSERLDLYRVCWPIMVRSGAIDQRFSGPDKMHNRRKYATIMHQVLGNEAHARDLDPVTLLARYNDLMSLRVGGVATSEQQPYLERGVEVIEMLEGLHVALSTLRNIWNTNPVESGKKSRWYRNQQETVVENLGHWMQTGFALVGGWKEGKPRRETIAFCAIIGALAGRPGEPVKLSVTIESKSRDEVIVIQ